MLGLIGIRMIIGVPKEIKTDEYRVGMLAVGAELLYVCRHETSSSEILL